MCDMLSTPRLSHSLYHLIDQPSQAATTGLKGLHIPYQPPGSTQGRGGLSLCFIQFLFGNLQYQNHFTHLSDIMTIVIIRGIWGFNQHSLHLIR